MEQNKEQHTQANDLDGIATLSYDPLATYHLHGKPTKKRSSRR